MTEMSTNPTAQHDIVRRPDARAKVTGKAVYAADLIRSGMLFAAVVESPHAFARVRHVDGAAARAMDGVEAVLTAADIPGRNQIGVIQKDQPAIVSDWARHPGDCVALVAADSPDLAHRAAQAVGVDYEVLEPQLDTLKNLDQNNPLIHPERDQRDNLCSRHKIRRGDMEAGWREADVVVEADLETGAQEHMYLEPMACLVTPEPDGRLRVEGSMQCPYYVQAAVASVTGLPFSKVRVIQGTTGGGFGGKEDTPSEFFSRCALLAQAVDRPVKLFLDREQDIRLTSKRHPTRMHYRVGAKRDGTLTAIEARIVGDAGAYATLTPVVMYRSTVHACGPYRVPNACVDTFGVYTNRVPSGAFRGFGAPQACFGIETVMDRVAAALQLDPCEVRLRNALRPGDEAVTSHALPSCAGLEDTIRVARERSGWSQKWHPPGAGSSGRYREGMGMATIHYGNSLGSPGWYLDASGAHLQINRDGSVALAIGHTELGQGVLTVLPMIVAQALGVTREHVTMRPVDTDNLPDCGPTVASRATIMSGNAILDAAGQLLDRLRPLAAKLLEGDEDELQIEEGKFYLRSDPESFMTWEELAEEAFLANVHLAAVGWWVAPPSTFDSETGKGTCYFQYAYATHVARVQVDTWTGKVRVEKFTCVHDVGRAIYPTGIEGQIEGGVSQGVGYALLEDLRENSSGHILTHNFSTYILPSAMEAVPDVETVCLEYPAPHGPLGVRSVGEPAIIPVASAVACAIANAIGLPVDRIPCTAERLRLAWRSAAGEGGEIES